MNDLTALQTTMDVTDVAGQLARRSQRIYENETLRLATWLNEHNLTIPTLTHSAMRSDISCSLMLSPAHQLFAALLLEQGGLYHDARTATRAPQFLRNLAPIPTSAP